MSDVLSQPDTLPRSAAELAQALNLGAAAAADLTRYRELVEAGNARLNLVGPSALAEFWPRHAYDGAQLLQLAPYATRWADLGSGAGLPGVVLAIALKGRPGAHVQLVESLAKRCRFLREIVAELGLPAEVVEGRAEAQSPPPVQVVTARALAPLERLLGYAQPYLRGDAVGLFLKGRSAAEDVAAARSAWRFSADLLPSRSHPEGRIVRITGLAHG